MISRAAAVGFLTTPTNDKVSAKIGAALREHWAATAAAARAQFWGKSSQNWLNVPRHYLNRFTTSR